VLTRDLRKLYKDLMISQYGGGDFEKYELFFRSFYNWVVFYI